MIAGILISIGTTTLQVTEIARYGAKMMPYVVAVALFILGAVIFRQGRRTLAASGSQTNNAGDTKKTFLPSLPVMLTFFLLAFYVLAIEPIGFPLATFAYVLMQTFVLSDFDKRKLPIAFLIALVGSVTIHYIFTNYFYVLLPSGILG